MGPSSFGNRQISIALLPQLVVPLPIGYGDAVGLKGPQLKADVLAAFKGLGIRVRIPEIPVGKNGE